MNSNIHTQGRPSLWACGLRVLIPCSHRSRRDYVRQPRRGGKGPTTRKTSLGQEAKQRISSHGPKTAGTGLAIFQKPWVLITNTIGQRGRHCPPRFSGVGLARAQPGSGHSAGLGFLFAAASPQDGEWECIRGRRWIGGWVVRCWMLGCRSGFFFFFFFGCHAHSHPRSEERSRRPAIYRVASAQSEAMRIAKASMCRCVEASG